MLILASKSPRRKELLGKIAPSFMVIPPDIDEDEARQIPSDHPLDVARLKAYKIFQTHPDDDVLSCDTIVIVHEQILGKPHDVKDAQRMLRLLSGQKHVVLSGYTFINRDREVSRTVKTIVYFKALSDELIDRYVATGLPLDKAGAYGIQDGFLLVERIEGSYDNVVGLPTEDIAKHCFRS